MQANLNTTAKLKNIFYKQKKVESDNKTSAQWFTILLVW